MAAVLALALALAAPAEAERLAGRFVLGGPEGFALEVPAPLVTKAWGSDAVGIGTPREGGFDAVAFAGEGQDFPGFEAFALAELRSFCAPNGTVGSVSWAEPQQRQRFVTAWGLVGEVLCLRCLHETFATGERVVDGWGPIFLFDVSDAASGDGRAVGAAAVPSGGGGRPRSAARWRKACRGPEAR